MAGLRGGSRPEVTPGLGLAPHSVEVAVEDMRVRGPHEEVAVRDVGAVELRWWRRDAQCRGVGPVAWRLLRHRGLRIHHSVQASSRRLSRRTDPAC